ncbi:hypothetical protein CEXT_508251 [Caerostris extrusa]|uniref:Uncharacterized protein n=1 Tax=Caerostris extrusa TaxID=172846 RepID=A0AAV4TWQ5_CAEEX|nr:hypothetical protein CEXT_508251 [Caerostris extrusa]
MQKSNQKPRYWIGKTDTCREKGDTMLNWVKLIIGKTHKEELPYPLSDRKVNSVPKIYSWVQLTTVACTVLQNTLTSC